MNRISSVEDIDFGEVATRHYDLAIFASGHETRAKHVSTLLAPTSIARTGIFGFDSSRDAGARHENDAYFRDRWNTSPLLLSDRAEAQIYDFLFTSLRGVSHAKILIDYSSMTRFWYAAILNWFRFYEHCKEFQIDFLYCAGSYASEIPTLQINDILSIPGCEGNTASAGPSVALLGLGFDNNSVQCVLDDLEPDIVKPFIAAGAARQEYVSEVKRANGELLEHCDSALEFPLESVATTLTCLSEVVAPYNDGYNVSIVPLGPKPHVLASILLAMRLPQVACLHVSGVRTPPWNALPTDRLIGTRVRFHGIVEG